MVYLDPFDKVAGMSFSKKTWMLTNNGEFIGVEPDGTQTDISTVWPGSIAGMAVFGQRVFAAEFSGANSIHANNYVDSTNAPFIDNPAIDTLNDVASDGTYLYACGADGSGNQLLVSKYTLSGGGLVWTKDLGPLFGAVSIAANPLGFMLLDENRVRFYDPEGVQTGTGAVIDMLQYQWSVCATRDRFFVTDKTDNTASGIVRIQCYDIAGNLQYTVTPPAPVVAAQEAWPSVNESHFFVWLPIGFPNANVSVQVMDRTVTRDPNTGAILTDVVDTGSAVVYDLGIAFANPNKASVDAQTFINY